MISASSFWMRLAEVVRALEALGPDLESLRLFSELDAVDMMRHSTTPWRRRRRWRRWRRWRQRTEVASGDGG